MSTHLGVTVVGCICNRTDELELEGSFYYFGCIFIVQLDSDITSQRTQHFRSPSWRPRTFQADCVDLSKVPRRTVIN